LADQGKLTFATGDAPNGTMASAWHAIRCHGEGAIGRAEAQVARSEQQGSRSGVIVFRECSVGLRCCRRSPRRSGPRLMQAGQRIDEAVTLVRDGTAFHFQRDARLAPLAAIGQLVPSEGSSRSRRRRW
jgi:hypothetical protein